MYSDQFLQQVQLLLQCLPAIRNQDYFALKGGTAINLIVRNLPRLSVDIDLTYKHLDDRNTSLSNIQTGLRKIGETIKNYNSQFVIKEQRNHKERYLSKILVYHNNTMVKIEPSFLMRGALFPIKEGALCKKVNSIFQSFLDKIPILSVADLYAGKLCAALNRQHPRDLFDVKLLLEDEGITEEIRQAFVIYLAGDSRPIHELLSPNRLEITNIFQKEFLRMTDISVSINELVLVRERLIKLINQKLTDNERQFLLSIKLGEPQYDLMPFKNLDKLPSLKWKVSNIQKMDSKKREIMLEKLKAVLEV